MIKHILVLAGLLFCSLGGTTQTEDPPVVIIAAGGKIDYISVDKSVKIKAVPGAVLKKSGKLKLASKASAVLYCDGRVQQLQGPGTFTFAKVFPKDAQAPLNFDPRFGRYIQMAIDLAAMQAQGDSKARGATAPPGVGDGWGRGVKDTIRSTDGWGRGVKDTIRSADGWGRGVKDTIRSGDGWGIKDTIRSADGWGGHGARIVAILPEGKVLAGIVTFSWSKPAGVTAYQVTIQDENDQVLYSATVKDTFVPIDLRPLNLTPGMVYYWRVQAAESPKLSSSPKGFVVASADEQARDIKRAAKSNVFNKGGADLKGLMEAAALEETEWYYDAQLKYAALYKLYPKNDMLRMMYSAFWVRAGVEPKAKEVMK